MTRKSTKPLGDEGPLVVVGGGQAGALMATFLAKRGHDVHIFESRPDPRLVDLDAGRSINMALATRGIVAMRELGIYDRVEPITLPMRGRMVHPEDGEVNFQPYGTSADHAIYSVGRHALNAILLDAAEDTGNVTMAFGQRCRGVDWSRRMLVLTDSTDEAMAEVPFDTLFGSDGANSEIRRSMQRVNGGSTSVEVLDHGYKELEIPAGPGGSFFLEPDALHIWPRGNYMLIALPNPDGTFTVTLFLPHEVDDPDVDSAASFATMTDPQAVEAFFAREFPDFVDLVPDLSEQFFANPTGDLATVRCNGWSQGDAGVLIGDAAHAIVPFHGQGMNLALESCRLLDRRLAQYPNDVAQAFTLFEMDRKPDADAIADMALDNYIEMRSGVTDPRYLIKRELALELERLFPDRIAARYGMVMFTTMPYSQVKSRAEDQAVILDKLTAHASSLQDVDFDRAEQLVGQLGPLPVQI